MMKVKARTIFVALALVIGCHVGFAAAPTQKTALDVLEVIDTVFRSDVLMDPTFYATSGGLKRYFHADSVTRSALPDRDKLKQEVIHLVNYDPVNRGGPPIVGSNIRAQLDGR
jgi:hypothetical protein